MLSGSSEHIVTKQSAPTTLNESADVDLDKFKIPGTCTCYFIPDFINDPYAESLLRKVESCPTPKWTVLADRRLQLWGCTNLSSKVMVEEPLPDWLKMLAGKIASEIGDDVSLFNQVLVNEYEPGQGILPHTDFYEATVPIPKFPKFSIFMKTNSLIVIKDSAYDLLHGIAQRKVDVVGKERCANWELAGLDELAGGMDSVVVERTKTRVSLTFRIAKNTVKKDKLFGLLRR